VAADPPAVSLTMLAVDTFTAHRVRGAEPAVAIAGTAVLGASFTLSQLWARGVNPMPPCMFHLLTGQPCPFCGGTRSFVALVRGDVGAAVHVFPIGPLLFLALVIAVAYSIWSLVTGTRVRVRMEPRLVRALTVLGLAILLANWVSKILILGY
jgi:uncharacterized membrane protein YfcA